MASKVETLSKAISRIKSGQHLTLSGFGITRCCVAAVHELIRQNKGDFTLSQCIGSMDTDLMVGNDRVKRLYYGGGSLDRFGPIFNINRRIEDGRLEAHEYSSLSVCFKHLAGALGIPFIPIKSLLGSGIYNMLREKYGDSEIQEMTDPFTGDKVAVLRALKPDWAIIQVQRADEEGNAQLFGPTWDAEVAAKASEHIIIIAEEIIPTETLRKHPQNTMIPAFRVDSVVPLYFGAYPSSVFSYYDYDAAHLTLYEEHARDPKKYKEYIDKYVLGVKNHDEYLALSAGDKKLRELRAHGLLNSYGGLQ